MRRPLIVEHRRVQPLQPTRRRTARDRLRRTPTTTRSPSPPSGLYKAAFVHFDAPWQTVEELELATLVWLDWWNTIRLQSSIGDIPPVEYEQRYDETTRQHPLPGTPSAH